MALIAVASNEIPEKGEMPAIEEQFYSIVAKNFRYIRANDGGEELYDHRKDPAEKNNIASNPDYSNVLAYMRKTLDLELNYSNQ